MGCYINKNPQTNFFGSNPASIEVQLKDGSIIELKKPEDYSKEEKEFLEFLSLTAAILSYREIMKIYNLKTKKDFYDLFLRDIMAGYPIPPKREKTIGELVEEVDDLQKFLNEYIGDKRSSDYRRKNKRFEELSVQILDESNKIFSELKGQWNEYLHRLIGDDSIEVGCEIKKLGELEFTVKWHGETIKDFFTVLNEGKLNSISLALFLSYLKKYNPSPYKLLLLDDVLIGLDMDMRIPVLELLVEDFSNYQIIMTTYDQYWFQLMKMRLKGSEWNFSELIVKTTDNPNLPFYIAVESPDYLTKAKNYLYNGDLIASAVYARLEFERQLKKYAKNNRIKIPYESNKIDDFWQVIKSRISEPVKSEVELYRAILLNPAIHFDQRPKYKKEVEKTVGVIEKVKSEL